MNMAQFKCVLGNYSLATARRLLFKIRKLPLQRRGQHLPPQPYKSKFNKATLASEITDHISRILRG
jgi:hypothetical protein